MYSDKVLKALEYVDADDRMTWVKVGTALKSEYGESGFELFDQWSSKSSKYDPKVLKQQWRNFKADRVNIGTLFYLAKQNGYVPEKTKREYTPEEKAAYREKMQAQKVQAQAQAKQVQQQENDVKAKAIAQCQQRWNQAKPAHNGHPYLSRKGIDTDYVRRILKVEGDKLLVPIRSFGQIKGLQEIHPSGFKHFTKDCEVKGNALFIGSWDKVKNDHEVVVAEGLATGISVHLATNKTVAIAFNGHNLEDVVEKLSKTENIKIVIAADNDKSKVGLAYAQKAQAICPDRCDIVMPTFKAEHAQFKDWNDYWLKYEQDSVSQMEKEPMREIFDRTFAQIGQKQVEEVQNEIEASKDLVM